MLKPSRWLLSSLVLGLLGSVPVPGEAPPARVTVEDSRKNIVLSNGLITATFSKASGELISLKARDRGELLGNGGRGYYDLAIPKGTWSLRGGVFRLVRAADDLAEISFTREFTGCAVDLRFVLRKGESGFHVFAVHRHAPGRIAVPIGQSRFTLRVDPQRFDYAFASESKHGPMVAPALLKMAKMITDATYLLLDGLIYSKYDWSDTLDGHWGHGVVGDGLGVWILHGSMEYFMGGPTRQDLTVHATDTTPVLLEMYTSHHFLGEDVEDVPREGGWSKLYGPTFVYVNSGKDRQALFQDARQQAQRLQEAWPYRWMKHELYPLERGTVQGQISLKDGTPAANATVLLTAPCHDWQVQLKDYVFWTHADRDGRFLLRHVRPGTYTLYSFTPGVLGELRKEDIHVKAEGNTDLNRLVWAPPANGRRLWQIGTPDRSAAEFRHGDKPRQFGLWNRYRKEFPADVDFIIGQSKERTDWNYAQVIVQKEDGSWQTPTWNVRFDVKERLKGKATLSLAIAGADGTPGLHVLVNGRKVESLRFFNDSSVRRSATQAGHYRLHQVAFDAGLLRDGQNTLALQMYANVPRGRGPRPLPAAAILYDCLRLEVDDAVSP